MIEAISKEIFFGSLNTILGMAKVVIPLMIIIQLMRDYHILEKLSQKLEFISRILGISKEAIFPLIIGMVTGISYGAGAVMEATKEAGLSQRDIFLTGIFLSCCHGILETTLIFAVIGANFWVLTVVRLGIAIILTMVFARIIKFDNESKLKMNIKDNK